MRVLIAECKQEVSTFNPALSRYEDFVTSEGGEILDFHEGIRSEVGGALTVFRDANIDVVGAFSARSNTSGGTLAAEDWDRLATDFLDGIRTAPRVDGYFIAMHGAMCAENESDPEGYLLQETRKIVGPDVPIVCSFDLHGIVTDRMLEQIDGLAAYHTYPHNDFFETGARAATLLVRIMRGEAKPVTAVVRIPALVRGDELDTSTGLIGGRIREAQAFEAAGGLSGNMFWGNPFTDVPELSSYSVVITNDDPERAKQLAVEMAEHFWADRAKMQAPLVSLDEAVR
ncbi:MAG TPA: M81 family metallopeptidase, partial [Thermomicrobiales bacterium]|nr:M81 family metallopeptidase [Thermomicrobiales bacterium]